MKVRTLLKHMANEPDEVDIYAGTASLSCGRSSLDTFRSMYADCKVDHFTIEFDQATGMTTLVICVKDLTDALI